VKDRAKKLQKLLHRVSARKILLVTQTMEDEGITCALCLNNEWWPANGYTQAEREAICGYIGCPTVPPDTNG